MSSHHQLSNRKVVSRTNHLSNKDRITLLEGQLATANYQLTKLYTKVDLLCKWIKNKYGDEFHFGIVDKVVLQDIGNQGQQDVMSDGYDEDRAQDDEITVAEAQGLSEHAIIDVSSCANGSESVKKKTKAKVNHRRHCKRVTKNPIRKESVETTTRVKMQAVKKPKVVTSASTSWRKHDKGSQHGKKHAKSSSDQTDHQSLKKYKFDKSGRIYFACTWADCRKRCKSNSLLVMHLNRHKSIKPYICNWNNCGKSFCTKSDLGRHIRVHTGDKRYKCDVPKCGKGFAQSCALVRHKRLHTGEKPYCCGFCSKSFAYRTSMTYHILRWHTIERAFKCENCHKSFITSTEVKIHKKNCHASPGI